MNYVTLWIVTFHGC